MLKLLTHLRAIVPVLLLCAALAVPAGAQTQRNPDNSVNPTASSVNEDRRGRRTAGRKHHRVVRIPQKQCGHVPGSQALDILVNGIDLGR